MSPHPRWVAAPPWEARRRALGEALGALVPGWRALAENLLGADERIDWVGLDAEGGAVIALLGDSGDDLGLVARGLAQRQWVEARLPDWAQLAPQAGIHVEAGVRVLLIAPEFRAVARAAARAAGPGFGLARLRFVENGHEAAPLIEAIGELPETASEQGGGGAAGFRTGLSAEDLDLSAEELAELQGRDD